MRVATVCGGAAAVWDELERARELVGQICRPGDELVHLAVNEAGIHHPDPLHHWCTLHHEKLPGWTKERAELGKSSTPRTWGVTTRALVDQVQRVWRGGSSGLHAVDVALHPLEADAVILCGVWMDGTRNRFSGKDWGDYRRYRPDWTKAMPELEERVKSFGGWTHDTLGAPTIEWLEGVRCRI